MGFEYGAKVEYPLSKSVKSILLALYCLLSITAFSQHCADGLPLHPNGPNIVGKQSEYLQASRVAAYAYASVRAVHEVNLPSIADAYPWISANALRLYFTQGQTGNTMLMFTTRPNINSYFGVPDTVLLPIANLQSVWLSGNELDLYAGNAQDLYHFERNTITTAFSPPVLIDLIGLGTAQFAGPSLNAAQDELFIHVAGTAPYIARFTKTSSTSFTYASYVSLPSGYAPMSGQLSKDDLTYFLGARQNGGKPKLHQLTRTLPTASFLATTFEEVQGINDTTMWNIQPSMSDSMHWAAFVRSASNFWDYNDLFIAYNGIMSPAFEPSPFALDLTVFPNPSHWAFTVQVSAPDGIHEGDLLQIYNAVGEKVLQQPATAETYTEGLPEGIYFLVLSSGLERRMAKVIVH